MSENLAENFVKSVAGAFPKLNGTTSAYSMWLERGKVYFVEPFTKREQEAIDAVMKVTGWRRMQLKGCYSNTQRVLTNDFSNVFRYCEGWYYFPELGVPLHHAWLTINGKVFDPTVALMKDREQPHYFGIQIRRDTVIRALLETKTHFGLTDDPRWIRKLLYKRKSPALTHKA